ncbi:MAG: PAS domain S-box protein, partial [Candidatus Hodarchaeota archaeon]
MSRILLVDDDQDLLTIAMNLLGREEPNFEIIAVLSASDALQKLATEHFDLIVADYQMPGMTGLELLKQLRTEGNDIPFIVFTGKGREEIAIDALNLGADRYLNKTGDTRSLFAELAHSIQSLIEHKKTKDALLEREIRFRELFANMSSGVAVYEAVDDGKDFIFKDLNAAGAKFTDLKKHDVLGVPVTKAFPSVKDFGLFDVFQNVWQTGKAEHHPASFYQDNRIARWYENFVYRLPSGEIVAVFDDVTKQKQAEEALRESNERYRSFVYSFPGIAFQGTMEFQPIFFHGASEEITGYTEAEFLEGNPRWDQCFHPHDLEKLSQSIEKIATIPGYSTTREYRIIRKDGQTRWIHEVIQNVPDQNGTPSYVQGIILDITDRKRAEEALQASEASFRMMFEYAPIGYHSLDENGIIQDVNHGWLEQLGYARTEAIGRPLKDFLAPSSREKFEHIFAQFKIAGEVHGIEYELVHKDSSELLVECDGRVQYDEEGNFERTHCTFRDITDRKQTEEALRESEEQFRLAFENANIG